jgi:L-asparaginase/Glu-tRNA(Gln) amidotransferase subunit D
MKVAAGIVSVCVALFLLGGGCSKEEEPTVPAKEIKVVKTIKKPVSEKSAVPSTTQEVEEKQAEKQQEKQEEKTGEEVKVVAVQQIAPKDLEKVSKEIETVVEQEGYYIVKGGDSLASVAAKENVYGDPLKWPVLYRLNTDKFVNIPLGGDFPDRNLAEGVMLKMITSGEQEENLKTRANHFWVVNVLSSTKTEKIIPSAIRLIKDGYPVYITKATVKGKDYMRLRVGFFNSKDQAHTEGTKIMAMLKLTDSWTNKIGPTEFDEFARY